MEIIRGLEELKESYPNTVITIGNFDGLHLGHQKIIHTVLRDSQDIRGTSMVVTFDPHPMKVLAPEKEVKLLTTPRERERLIQTMGIQVLLCITFDKAFSSLEPDEFIKDILVKKINAKEVIVGQNYAFGKARKGTTELLRRRGRKYRFSVKAVRHAKLNGEIVSSSKIRSFLSMGQVFEASTFLGRAYTIEGNVIKGAGRGEKLLHVPTANITTPNELVPREGVYAVRVGLRRSFFDGVANIGKKPTFSDSVPSYEVHLFNFNGNLLGESLRIHFVDWIRNQRSFPDALSLEKQIRSDIEQAKEILNKKKPILI
jgi:riboflavin kinase/FMN adenylyltransferase